jgi:hypothetical protein
MSDDKIDKEVFDVHMKNITKGLDVLHDKTTKLFESQSKMNAILAKNTVTVKEHHIRSTRLEEIQVEMLKTIEKVNSEMKLTQREIEIVDNKVGEIQTSLEPIEEHVESMNKGFVLFTKIPSFIKWALGLIVGGSILLGLLNGSTQIGDILSFIVK